MRTIRFLLQKEFRQIFRNKVILVMILVMPAIQLMILPLAADYEVKNINISIVEHDQADLILEIPHGFERNLIREGEQKMFIAVNAINGVKANLGGSYLSSIIRNYNEDIRLELISPTQVVQNPGIEIVSSNWFNNLLNYRVF